MDPLAALPVDLRPLPKEPDNEKKKGSKSKAVKISKSKADKNIESAMDKLNISYPTNFEHTVHVGFDPITGEFTVMTQFK